MEKSYQRSRRLLILGGWILALGIAVALDAPVARYIRHYGIHSYMRSHKPLQQVMEVPGEYWFTLAVMVAMLFHPLRWRASLLVLMATTLTGLNTSVKWAIGRFRPFKHFDESTRQITPFDFHPFAGGWSGLWGGVPNFCLPSGHTLLAFATAASASILVPRGKWIFYPLAAMVGVERVLENAHWVSDVVAGAALGVGSVWLVRHVVWETYFGRHGKALPLAGDPRLQRAGEHPHALEAR